jgi:hypothetical protein
MNKVSYSEGNNVGGVQSLFLTNKNLISRLYPITFMQGYDWTEMEFLPESAGCKDSTSDSDNGTVYNYSLVFGFNKQREALYTAFAQFIGKLGIAMFTDNNGLTRILGTLVNPVTVKQEGDTGNAPADLNYFKITLTWTHFRPARVV